MATDPSQLKPVPIQKTLLLVNNFVINTCSFLDSFADKCDTGLSKLRDRITELEILTIVLEAKLKSIPDLEGENAEPITRPAPPTSTPSTSDAPPSAPPPPPSVSISATVDQSMELVPAVAVESTNEDPSTIAISKHPNFRKYFKMIEMGIPVAAAKIKMTNDGVDPALLDTPDLRIPNDVTVEE